MYYNNKNIRDLKKDRIQSWSRGRKKLCSRAWIAEIPFSTLTEMYGSFSGYEISQHDKGDHTRSSFVNKAQGNELTNVWDELEF